MPCDLPTENSIQKTVYHRAEPCTTFLEDCETEARNYGELDNFEPTLNASDLILSGENPTPTFDAKTYSLSMDQGDQHPRAIGEP
jgi:hypothetical protein